MILRNNKLLNIAREGFWIVLGQFFSIIGNLVFIKVMTTKLEPIIFGKVSLILSISIFFSQLLYGGVGAGVARFFSVAEINSDFWGYFDNSKKIVYKISFGFLLIGLFALIGLSITGHISIISLTIYVIFISILNGIISVLNSFQNCARERAFVSLINGFGVIVKILLVLLFFDLSGANEINLVRAIFLSAIAVLIIQLIFLRNKLKIKIEHKSTSIYNWSSQIWEYSSSIILWGGFMALYQLSDKWALGHFNSLKDVGAYNVLFQLGYVPTLLVLTSVLTLLSPIIYQRSGDGKDLSKNKKVDSIITTLIWLNFLFSIVGFILTYFFHNKIFGFLTSKTYLDYSYLLPYVVLSAGFFSAGQILNLKMESKIRVKEMVFIKVSTSIFGILLNFLLAATHGINGVLVGSFIYALIFYFGMLFVSKKY
jgi:O-antigen/teichoic acid export membrane protein